MSDGDDWRTSRRGVLAVLGSALTGGCLNLQETGGETTTRTAVTTRTSTATTTTEATDEPTERTTRTTEQTTAAPFEERAAGNVRWAHQARTSITSTPLAVNDLVVVGVGDGTLRALDTETRAQRWRANVGGVDQPPLSADGVLYVPGDGLSVLDPASGDVQWTFRDCDGTPLRHGDALLTHSGIGRVYALDPSDGSVMWEYNVNETYDSGGVNGTLYEPQPMAVADGTLYVVSDTEAARWVHELDPASGSERAVWKLGSGSAMQTAATGGVLVTQFEDEPGVYETAAYDLDSGAQQWRTECGLHGFRVAGGVVYFGNRTGGVSAVDLSSGEGLWSKDWDSPQPPVRDGDTVYATRNGAVYALDAESGSVRWSGGPSAEATTPVGVGTESVYVGTESGQTYSIWRPA